MPPDGELATSDAKAPPDEELEVLRSTLASADARDVDALLRQYIDLYLVALDHPEQSATSSADLGALAEEVNGSLSFSRPEITPATTFEYLESLISGAAYPSDDPQVKAVHHAAEPVMMFNGQFVHS